MNPRCSWRLSSSSCVQLKGVKTKGAVCFGAQNPETHTAAVPLYIYTSSDRPRHTQACKHLSVFNSIKLRGDYCNSLKPCLNVVVSQKHTICLKYNIYCSHKKCLIWDKPYKYSEETTIIKTLACTSVKHCTQHNSVKEWFNQKWTFAEVDIPDVEELVSLSDLKKCSIQSLAQQWILCSEWVPAVQTSQ